MAIQLNDNIVPADNILIDGCPQIITIPSSVSFSLQAQCTFTVSACTDGQVLCLNDEINVMATDDLTKEGGNKFYCGGTNNNRIAASLVNALRSVPQLIVNYNAYLDGDGKVSVMARQGGKLYDITVTTNECGFAVNNIPSYTPSVIQNKMYIDVTNNLDYVPTHVTTLQKTNNYLNRDVVMFNLSNVFQSLTDYDSVTKVKLTAYSIGNAKYKDEGEITVNLLRGYKSPNSKEYIPITTVLQYPTEYSYMIYNPTMYISSLIDKQVTIYYKASDGSNIGNETIELTKGLTYKQLNTSYMAQAYELVIDSGEERMTWKVMKPAYAVDASNIRRIYWRNEYGGLSQVDLIATSQPTNDTQASTSYVSNLNYYTNELRGNEEVYAVTNTLTEELTTSLISDEDRKCLESLRFSRLSYIDDNGTKRRVIIQSITYEPRDNMYQAIIQIKYSNEL